MESKNQSCAISSYFSEQCIGSLSMWLLVSWTMFLWLRTSITEERKVIKISVCELSGYNSSISNSYTVFLYKKSLGLFTQRYANNLILLFRILLFIWFFLKDVFHYLSMIRSQYNPSTETIAQIDHSSTTAKSNDIGQCCTQRQNKELKKTMLTVRIHPSICYSHVVTTNKINTNSTKIPGDPYIILLKET